MLTFCNIMNNRNFYTPENQDKKHTHFNKQRLKKKKRSISSKNKRESQTCLDQDQEYPKQ